MIKIDGVTAQKEGRWKFKATKDQSFLISGFEWADLTKPIPDVISLVPILKAGEHGPELDLVKICIWKGYAWDGASGPAIDTPNYRTGSKIHDVLYQLIRLEVLANTKENRFRADEVLYKVCEAGIFNTYKGKFTQKMSRLRRWLGKFGVNTFAKRSSQPGYEQVEEVLIVPQGDLE